MYLNKLILIIASSFICALGVAQANEVKRPDSLIMKFGDKSKILFLIDGEKDLYQIHKYDLNAMVEDISIGLDTTNGTTFLTISDPSGQKYLMKNTKGISNNINVQTFTSSDLERLKEEIRAEIKSEFGKQSNKSDVIEDKKKRNFRLRQSGIHSFTNFEVGFTNYLQDFELPNAYDNAYSLRPLGSNTFAVNFIGKTNVLGPLFLEWGPGISFHQFRLEETNYKVVKDRDLGQLTFVPQGPEIEGIKSQYNTTYLNFSFMPSIDLGWFRFNRKTKFYSDWRGYSSGALRFGLGGYAGYRIASRSRYEYKENNQSFKDISKSDHYLNNWRYGVRAQVGWRGIDIFATYDLNTLFARNRGPELNMVSFGIII